MTEVTQILQLIEDGDPKATEQLLPLVYDELRKLAAARLSSEKPGETLQATALVHEAYLRLVGAENSQRWDSRGHFFAAAAEAMRRILIDNARRENRQKRGGKWQRIELDSIFPAIDAPPEALLAMDEAMSKLEQESPHAYELLKLRYYAGCSLEEAANAMGISRATAKRYWSFARAWLFSELVETQ